MTLVNLSPNPSEVIPDCSRDSEFQFSKEAMSRVGHDTFSPTGIGHNYINYWAGVHYWAEALRDNRTEDYSWLEPIPMTYSEYRSRLHPECPVTPNNLYTIAAIDALASEAKEFFSSERSTDPATQDYLFEMYRKAKFLVFGPNSSNGEST